MALSSLNLPVILIDRMKAAGFETPYPIQEKAIPEILKGHDVLGIAKTGSGKTASYVLPILSLLQKEKSDKNRHVSCLVLVPTRELAVQVEDVFKSFENDIAKSKAVFGGVSINPQMKGLLGVDILIATPGRLLDLIDSNAVHLSDLDILVLDEADKMLSLGFKEDMDKILNLTPKKCQKLMFSATLSDDLTSFNQMVLSNPIVVKIEGESDEPDIEQITQIAYSVEEPKKGPLLRHLIRDKKMSQVLIFTASGRKADNVAEKLRKNGIEARSIHGKKTQGVRTDLLTKFKYKRLPVLVATDLLARGIDIEALPFVINYELPRSPKDYIHRIGRTGRAEESGEAISLITPADEHHFKIIQKKMGKQVDRIESADLAV